MKRAEIKDRSRYVVKVNGKLTVVLAIRHGGGWQYRCERSHHFVSLTARHLWRPADDCEGWDSQTGQDCAWASTWVTFAELLRNCLRSWFNVRSVGRIIRVFNVVAFIYRGDGY